MDNAGYINDLFQMIRRNPEARSALQARLNACGLCISPSSSFKIVRLRPFHVHRLVCVSKVFKFVGFARNQGYGRNCHLVKAEWNLTSH